LKQYDYVIVGAGICGCTTAYELHKNSQKNILLIDKLSDVAQGASGAAGAFLSPLLGKPNDFKDLVTKSLKYSTNFYKKNSGKFINNCGTIRIPKDEIDKEKFDSYKPFMDFEYEEKEGGYYFEIGSIVETYNTCKELTKAIEKKFNYEVVSIKYEKENWCINDEIITKNLILTTGADTKLIEEKYFNIRPVWGQRIDIETSTCININYHKECSLSVSKQTTKGTYISSIGATHHRNVYEKKIDNNDTQELLKKANDIKQLSDVKVLKILAGARASSVDYLPIVGEVIDSKKTLEEFPYLKNGTHVNEERFSRYKNLYVINGVGGRGFVLAPYLAKHLSALILSKKECEKSVTTDRLFKRWVKKQ
jgi:glycine/D-amino acid oxidase-like deaminating enzyme